LVQLTKTGKIYQIIIRVPQNIPNGNEMDQMDIKMPTSAIARPSKIYPVWTFGHLATLHQCLLLTLNRFLITGRVTSGWFLKKLVEVREQPDLG
jgi:hypothetical protein